MTKKCLLFYFTVLNISRRIKEFYLHYSAFQVWLAAWRVHIPCYSYERLTAISLHKNVSSKRKGWAVALAEPETARSG